MNEAVAAFMNSKFVRSFSERLAGGLKVRRAERWWRRLREQKLAGVCVCWHAICLLVVDSGVTAPRAKITVCFKE